MKSIRNITLIFISSLYVSCGTMAVYSKVERLSVGMSKAEVIEVMGKKYQIAHSEVSPRGVETELLTYKDAVIRTEYEFEFRDGILVRFCKIGECDHDHSHDHQHHNHRH